jgi:hypothetical protein
MTTANYSGVVHSKLITLGLMLGCACMLGILLLNSCNNHEVTSPIVEVSIDTTKKSIASVTQGRWRYATVGLQERSENREWPGGYGIADYSTGSARNLVEVRVFDRDDSHVRVDFLFIGRKPTDFVDWIRLTCDARVTQALVMDSSQNGRKPIGELQKDMNSYLVPTWDKGHEGQIIIELQLGGAGVK